MSEEVLSNLVLTAGVGHFFILIASALVPFRLDWRKELACLPKLHLQMYWVYGGYVVLSIVAFGLIAVFNHRELAAGSGLARAYSGYVAVFWGVRTCLQAVLDVRQHLTAWWLKLGYHGLTVMFVSFTAIFGYIAVRPS